ncbi:MAG TPA: YbhB/YbcL family Raf kinase inhibitor-like protein [Vicinamibacterales bacterium]|nr:YbhB/YbcL family Raf kinase inhibitor-like protein [Vicinamibacterales bacterium]
MRLRRVIYAAVIATFAVPVWAQTPATLTVTSPTIKANETVPVDHTADGKNYSPAITWSGAPANTKQFALVYDDPDVVFGGQTFVHWVVYKIPGTAKGLPGELPMEAVLTAPPEIAGTIQGLSGFKRAGYRGPAPPAGKPHHYTWTVYALDAELPLEPGLNRNQLMEAIKGHIIGQGSLVAIYERKPRI